MKNIVCSKFLFVYSLLAIVLLTACGESGSSDVVEKTSDSDVVSDIANLPKCSKASEGLRVYVKSDNSYRVCYQGDWFAVLNSSITNDTLRVISDCSTSALEDSTGVKILCDGDSVGTILSGENGADGSLGKDGVQGMSGEKGESGNDGANGNDGNSCSVEALANNEGLKVLCGGDSVGVVLNGKNGLDAGSQLETLSNCSLISLNCIVHSVCGNDTSSLEIQSFDDACIQQDVLDSEAIAMNLENIYGMSQKGPFIKSSEVVAYELLDGRSLQQTGKKFLGEILSDKGDFNIRTVSLASQYATLVVKGFYFNEVTGNPSNSQITLTALTNLRGRSVANINLMTHLENERAQYLVIEGKMSVRNAKKKAEEEVFKLFHIDASQFVGYSEDLTIGGTSDADAALLAISILLQGDRSEADLTTLLTEISSSMETTGTWNDPEMKAAIADWAATADLDDRLSEFRANVKKMGLSLMVSNFEPFIKNYWYQELGLGNCSSENVGEVKAATAGSRKETDVRFTCVDSADVGHVWRISTNFEKDVYGWPPGEDGQKQTGEINKHLYYIYDQSISSWRPAADDPEMVWGGCVEKNNGTYNFLYTGVLYICKSRTWTLSKSIEIDTIGWGSGEDAAIKKGSQTSTNYVFDEQEGYWRPASALDVALKMNGCTSKRAGIMIKDTVVNSSYYEKYFMCHNDHLWKEVTDLIAQETEGYVCDEDGKIVRGKINSVSLFVCEKGSWRDASSSEEHLGKACLKSMKGSVENYDGVYYICSDNKWMSAYYYFPIGVDYFFSKDESVNYSNFVDPRDNKSYKVVRIKVGDYNQTWFAENLRYSNGGSGWCYDRKSGECNVGGRYYSWMDAMNVSSDIEIQEPYQGACPVGWHVPSIDEWESLYEAIGKNPYDLQVSGTMEWPNGTNKYGFSALPTGIVYYTGYSFSRSNVGTDAYFWTTTEKSSSLVYTCAIHTSSAEWYTGTGKNMGLPVRCIKDPEEDFSSLTCFRDGSLVKGILYPNQTYVCDADTFRVVTTNEMLLEVGCTSYNEGATKILGTSGYICHNSTWKIDANADFRSLSCDEDAALLDGVLYPSNKYVCDGGKIRAATEDELLMNKGCTSYNDGEQFVKEDVAYICDKAKWRIDPIEDYRGLKCVEDGSLQSGLINSENKYACDGGKIRPATELETMVGRVCVDMGEIVFNVDLGTSAYVDFLCTSENWMPMDLYDYSLEQWAKHLTYNQPKVTYGSMTDNRDGRDYKTLIIDGKTWMAENLQYADSSENLNLKGSTWCFDNLEKNCSIAGRLYTWGAAMNLPAGFDTKYAFEDGVDPANHQGICPDGWRLPTIAEWNSLINASRTGYDLESTGLITTGGATNSTGFSVVPSGYYDGFKFNFTRVGARPGASNAVAQYWSTTEYESHVQPAYVAQFYPGGIMQVLFSKNSGQSVRCIQNNFF